jgi:hypothetical protein
MMMRRQAPKNLIYQASVSEEVVYSYTQVDHAGTKETQRGRGYGVTVFVYHGVVVGLAEDARQVLACAYADVDGDAVAYGKGVAYPIA